MRLSVLTLVSPALLAEVSASVPLAALVGASAPLSVRLGAPYARLVMAVSICG